MSDVLSAPVNKKKHPDYRLYADDPNSFTTTLVICLIDMYGTEALSWAPATIRLETCDDWGTLWPGSTFDRLMAGIALITSNSFYKSLPDFNFLSAILSGAPATPDQFYPADVEDIAWAITEALLLSPSDDNDEAPFTDEIRAYIGAALENEGFITTPDILKLALHTDNYQTKINENVAQDDIELSTAIWQNQYDKTTEINEMIKGRLGLLIDQLHSLHLVHGDTEQIARRMMNGLKQYGAKGTEL